MNLDQGIACFDDNDFMLYKSRICKSLSLLLSPYFAQPVSIWLSDPISFHHSPALGCCPRALRSIMRVMHWTPLPMLFPSQLTLAQTDFVRRSLSSGERHEPHYPTASGLIAGLYECICLLLVVFSPSIPSLKNLLSSTSKLFIPQTSVCTTYIRHCQRPYDFRLYDFRLYDFRLTALLYHHFHPRLSTFLLSGTPSYRPSLSPPSTSFLFRP